MVRSGDDWCCSEQIIEVSQQWRTEEHDAARTPRESWTQCSSAQKGKLELRGSHVLLEHAMNMSAEDLCMEVGVK